MHKSVDVEEQSGDEVDSCPEDILPAYMPVREDGAPRVTMDSAIALVNRSVQSQ